MNIDMHWALNFLFGLVLIGFGWFCRELWAAVQALRKDLQLLEVRIGNDYVRYDRLQDSLKPIISKLDDIAEKLTHKVDRP